MPPPATCTQLPPFTKIWPWMRMAWKALWGSPNVSCRRQARRKGAAGQVQNTPPRDAPPALTCWHCTRRARLLPYRHASMPARSAKTPGAARTAAMTDAYRSPPRASRLGVATADPASAPPSVRCGLHGVLCTCTGDQHGMGVQRGGIAGLVQVRVHQCRFGHSLPVSCPAPLCAPAHVGGPRALELEAAQGGGAAQEEAVGQAGGARQRRVPAPAHRHA